MPSNNGYRHFSNSTKPRSYSDQSQSMASSSSSSYASSLSRPYSADELVMRGHPAPPLKLGDKIVWISDTGPEFGVVKWLGKLPDVGDEWMAGIDFVNPVGSGTGLYNDIKLFETRLNHASLVPIVGLLKASDFAQSCEPKANWRLVHEDAPIIPRRFLKEAKKLQQESYKFYADSVDSETLTCSTGRSCEQHSPQSQSPNELTKISDDLAELNIWKPSPRPTRNLMPKFGERAKSNSSDNLRHMSSRGNVETSPRSEIEFSQENRTREDAQPSRESDELFEIGTMVEVSINHASYYGVIRWLGFLKNDIDYPIDSIRRNDNNFINVIAGIELEDEISGLSNGTLNGKQYFSCASNKAYFTELNQCRHDSRFASTPSAKASNIEAAPSQMKTKNEAQAFGAIECPTVLGDVPPLSSSEQLTLLCGKNRGIQGNHNSCYLDATLFAMFACSTVFESLLYRPRNASDIPEYSEVQRILKEEIINPLRKNYYVRADRIMKLRQVLERISSMRGLTTEEKDPEEFLDLLLNEILKTQPYLRLTSGESCFYQLFVEKDENLEIPTVQQLFDQSFLAADIKLREIPPCLIIQMPRFGRDFKMYPRIIPSAQLDITNVLDNSPRQCIVCGRLAEWECKQCFGEMGEGLDSISFCSACLDTSHTGHRTRMKHGMTKLTIPSQFTMLKDHTNIPRVVMNLFAVLCIETSHYVSFVKCGTQSDSPWCFFDSMADRKGEQDGYNIPEVLAVPNLKFWQSEGAMELLTSTFKDDKLMPELPRRLLSDAYICFYSSPEVVRYR